MESQTGQKKGRIEQGNLPKHMKGAICRTRSKRVNSRDKELKGWGSSQEAAGIGKVSFTHSPRPDLVVMGERGGDGETEGVFIKGRTKKKGPSPPAWKGQGGANETGYQAKGGGKNWKGGGVHLSSHQDLPAGGKMGDCRLNSAKIWQRTFINLDIGDRFVTAKGSEGEKTGPGSQSRGEKPGDKTGVKNRGQ